MLKRLGLPTVTPHSARHCFISTLQAQGIEVGLVAKLAGHASAIVHSRTLYPGLPRGRECCRGAGAGLYGLNGPKLLRETSCVRKRYPDDR